MGLLQKLKSTLGLGGSRTRREDRRSGEGGVRVEHEPDATSEAAVKGSGDWDDEPAGDVAPTEEDADERSVGEDEVEVAEEAAEESTEDGADEASTDAKEPESAAGADVPVDELKGIGSAYAERLGNAGVESVADLAAADAASLDEETDIGQGRLEGWIEQAKDY